MALLEASKAADKAEPTGPTANLPEELLEFNKNGDLGDVAENNNIQQVPPVLITELSKAEIKLPAIREEKTQEEIVLRGGSPSKSRLGPETPGGHLTPITSVRDANSKSPRPHSLTKGRKTPSKKGDKTPKRSKSVSSSAAMDTTQQSNNNKNTFSKENVPNLPLISRSNPNLSQEGIATSRTDVTNGSSNVSDHWQTAITFVNQRVQNRLTQVRATCVIL